MSAEDTPGEQRRDRRDYPPESRVYPPHEVQGRLGLSASGLRRLAGIYERNVRPLPRDDRGRVWPEDAIGELERARALVRQQRAVSIEAALLGQTLEPGEPAPRPEPRSPERSAAGADVGAAILEELRALRGLVEEQNRRIAELEEAVRTGRELPAGEPTEAQDGPDDPAEGYGPGDPLGGAEAPVRRDERGPWRRVLDWFGFGGR